MQALGPDTSDSSAEGEQCELYTEDSGTSAQESGKRRPRRSISTYTVRKREKARLLGEVRGLQVRVDLLRRAGGLSTSRDVQMLNDAKKEREKLLKARRLQLLSLCGAYSMVSAELREHFALPLRRTIRLGADLHGRRHVLRSVHRDRLDDALKFMAERFRSADMSHPLHQKECWTASNGDLCLKSADVIHFDGVASVKRVYDAFMAFITNMEISISVVLGQLTLREDIDAVDTRISNHRLLSTVDEGLTLELNSVNFSEYYESYAGEQGREFAMFTTDCVEEDELYPYSPSERIRKDITAAVSFGLGWNPTDKAFYVIMRRCAFLKIHNPKFDTTTVMREALQSNLSAWGSVMNQAITENLNAQELQQSIR